MKKTYLAIAFLFVIVLSLILLLKYPIMKGAIKEEIIEDLDNPSLSKKAVENWTKVYLETWIPNKTAYQKNTEVRVRNNYTVMVYNVTTTLGMKTWEYWDTEHRLYELEPSEYEWFIYIVPDEQRIAYAYGWIKNE